MPSLALALVLVFLISFFYASIGHGGASGYLALFSILPLVSIAEKSASALVLNLLVSSLAFILFFRAGHFSWRFIWPFAALSVPAAFLGGWIKVPASAYHVLLAFSLLAAALRIFFDLTLANKDSQIRQPSKLLSIAVGGGIGFLSGIVGVGGGIFLSPLILIFNWASPKRCSAASAFFILVNSLAGLLGRFAGNHFQIHFSPVLIFLIVGAFCGGLGGSFLGARFFSNRFLKTVLASILLLACVKTLLSV